MFTYRAFGLAVLSELELPELHPARAVPCDVSVRKGPVPDVLDSAVRVGGASMTARQFLLRIDGVASYWVRDGQEIVVDPVDGGSDPLVRAYLVAAGFAVLLHQRGCLPLHGSSVVTPAGAVVFAGPSGVGKSTLASAFSRRGYPVLADDVTVVGFPDGVRPHAFPAYPSIRLCDDVLEGTGLPSESQRVPAAGEPKTGVPLLHGFAADPGPLHSVYLLEASATSGAAISPVSGLDKVRALAANTFRSRCVLGMGRELGHFQVAARVSAGVRVCRLTRGPDLRHLDELVRSVEDDLAGSVPVPTAAPGPGDGERSQDVPGARSAGRGEMG